MYKKFKTMKTIPKIVIFLLFAFLIYCLIVYILKLCYPIKYMENIINANKEENTNIDPYLILAIIKTESGFNEKAVSGKNAKGLMQIKDTTAKDVAKDNQNTTSFDYDLHNVDTNIKLGILYFNSLVKKYDGNYYLAICAYNAGMGNVDKWLNQNIVDANLNNAKENNIPFKETKKYLQKVVKTYKMYKLLYNK